MMWVLGKTNKIRQILDRTDLLNRTYKKSQIKSTYCNKTCNDENTYLVQR